MCCLPEGNNQKTSVSCWLLETARLLCWIRCCWTRRNFILWDGRIKFSSWLCRGNVLTWAMEFGFHFIKSFATWQRSCRDAFNRTKLDHMMKRKIPAEIHSIKRTRSRMRLFSRRRSRHQKDRPSSWCSRKFSLVNHDSKFRAFFLAPFSSLSWRLEHAYLYLRNFECPMGQKMSCPHFLQRPLVHLLVYVSPPCPPCPNSVWYRFLLRWS